MPALFGDQRKHGFKFLSPDTLVGLRLLVESALASFLILLDESRSVRLLLLPPFILAPRLFDGLQLLLQALRGLRGLRRTARSSCVGTTNISEKTARRWF